MSTISIICAIILAGVGSGTAEILRCHCGWMSEMPRRLTWAIGCSTLIVALNVLVAHHGVSDAIMSEVVWARLAVGVIAYGVLWLLLLQIWCQFAWLRHQGQQ